MVNTKDLAQIESKIIKFYNIIKDLYPVKKIILYGSYAKGMAHPDSDIDIGVIIDRDDYKEKISIATQLYHYASQVDSRIEPFCIFLHDYEKHERASILGEIIRTAIDII